MTNVKSISLFVVIFMIVYILMIYPGFKVSERYADLFREKATSLFSTWGDKGQVAFYDEKQGAYDTKIMIGNKEVFLPSGEQRGGFFMYSIQYRAFISTCLLIALFVATPVKLLKRVLFILGGLFLFHVFLFVNLYVMILDKFIETPELKLHQYGPETNKLITSIDQFINNGFGFTFFLVAMIWIAFVSIFDQSLRNKGLGRWSASKETSI